MPTNNPNVIPANSGYPQYAGNMIPDVYSARLIERCYQKPIAADISVTDWYQDITKCGEVIRFRTRPRVTTQLLPKDGRFKHQTIENTEVALAVNTRRGWSVKIDERDRASMCNWQKYLDAVTEEATNDIAMRIDKEMLCRIPAEASACNVGGSAGIQSGSYDMGEAGAPIVIDSTNIWEYMTYAQAVLEEQGDDCGSMRPYIVWPKVFKPILLNSPKITENPALAQACGDAACGAVLNGMVPEVIAGFDVYFSNNVCSTFDTVVNANAFNVPFGYREATAFHIFSEDMREMINKDVDTVDDYFQARVVYGMGVMRPELVGSLYARAA